MPPCLVATSFTVENSMVEGSVHRMSAKCWRTYVSWKIPSPPGPTK